MEDNEGVFISQLEANHRHEIGRLTHRRFVLAKREAELKEELKAVKADGDLLTNRILRMLRDGPQAPLFEEENLTHEECLKTPIREVITATELQLEQLEAVGVKTLGDFEKLRAGELDGYPDGIKSIKGMGQAKVDKWENEVLDWLAEHQAPDQDGQDDEAEEYEDATA